jgi:hypothetical protein
MGQRRRGARTCSDACRQAAYRRRRQSHRRELAEPPRPVEVEFSSVDKVMGATHDGPEPVYGTTVLAIPDGLTLDQWTEIGDQLSNSLNAVQWWVGDWMIYGYWHFEVDADGNRISAGVAAVNTTLATVGLDVPTVRRCWNAAAAFRPADRRQDGSFDLHSASAATDDPVASLDHAIANDLSAHQVSRLV